ncbi:hypothetical protein, partial [Erythrobacter donghaensis]|uniref:hypothetical protein n=1 Tax=Erythrobacter donghaensis TaxID=267135 RepID=UPI0018C636B9
RLPYLILLALLPALQAPLAVFRGQPAHPFALAAPRTWEFGIVGLLFAPPVAAVVKRLAAVAPPIAPIIP